MLYICATPIGNLDDITLRVIKTLQSVDLILAEDTRHTQKLLNHLDIKVKTVSYHQHNIVEKGAFAVEQLQAGKKIALVSDAGMPAISDPGAHLVQLCIENNLEFTVLPGATAFTIALVASGFNTEKFTFVGFLPSKTNQRKEELSKLTSLPHTLIFYEAPHRLIKMLTSAQGVFGDRNCAIARELTKKFEEVKRGKISETIQYFQENAPRGEFVVIIEGNYEKPSDIEIDYKKEVEKEMKQGLSKSHAIKNVAQKFNAPRNKVYSSVISNR